MDKCDHTQLNCGVNQPPIPAEPGCLLRCSFSYAPILFRSRMIVPERGRYPQVPGAGKFWIELHKCLTKILLIMENRTQFRLNCDSFCPGTKRPRHLLCRRKLTSPPRLLAIEPDRHNLPICNHGLQRTRPYGSPGCPVAWP